VPPPHACAVAFCTRHTIAVLRLRHITRPERIEGRAQAQLPTWVSSVKWYMGFFSIWRSLLCATSRSIRLRHAAALSVRRRVRNRRREREPVERRGREKASGERRRGGVVPVRVHQAGHGRGGGVGRQKRPQLMLVRRVELRERLGLPAAHAVLARQQRPAPSPPQHPAPSSQPQPAMHQPPVHTTQLWSRAARGAVAPFISRHSSVSRTRPKRQHACAAAEGITCPSLTSSPHPSSPSLPPPAAYTPARRKADSASPRRGCYWPPRLHHPFAPVRIPHQHPLQHGDFGGNGQGAAGHQGADRGRLSQARTFGVAVPILEAAAGLEPGGQVGLNK
jgi:hypothetical protein